MKVVGELGGETEILLDHEDGEALGLELRDGARQRLHDHRRQAFGDFVEQQDVGAGAQDARHGEHLLLAAGEPRALARLALGEVGKHGVDLRLGHGLATAGAQARRQAQVLFGGERGEDAALFGAIAQAQVRDAVRRPGDRLLAVHHDAAGARAHQAHDGAQQSGAPGAVAAEQRDHRAARHRQVHAVQDVALAVPGVQIADLDGGSHAVTVLRCWCALRGGAAEGCGVQCAPCNSLASLPM